MATGLSSSVAEDVLDALCNGVSFSVSAVWIKLHVGSPGAAGTSNAAQETSRKQASFAAASGGAISNDAVVQWSAVAATETFTHFSAWSASTSGTFLFSGTITTSQSTAGEAFVIPVGDMDVSITVAS